MNYVIKIENSSSNDTIKQVQSNYLHLTNEKIFSKLNYQNLKGEGRVKPGFAPMSQTPESF